MITDVHREHFDRREPVQNVRHLWSRHGEEVWRSDPGNLASVSWISGSSMLVRWWWPVYYDYDYLSRHLFAVGSSAYATLNKTGESQVVVISGESGAGKTESTKLIMQYLAAVNKSPSNLVTEQILEASPLLESFGNAKTVRNDNSSRFGKYLEVHFKE